MKSFRPLETFEFSGNVYVKDMIYTIRTPELREAAAVWLSEGKIKPSVDVSGVSASGIVI